MEGQKGRDTVRIASGEPSGAGSRGWIEQSGITEWYLFPALGRWGREAADSPITDHQMAKIIKRLAREAGLDPAVFSGHSLRSGLATSAAEGGASERSIMEQTRHRSSNRSVSISAAAASSRTMPHEAVSSASSQSTSGFLLKSFPLLQGSE